MKILMLNHNVAWQGGTFFRAFRVSAHLAKRGHQVTLLSIARKARFGITREERDGVEIIYTPDLFWGTGRTGWDPWDVLNRVCYLRNCDWDIVHAWDSRPVAIIPALAARWKSRQNACRLLTDWCDWWGRGGTQAERPGVISKLFYAPLETFFEERFRPYADGTTVISQALYGRAASLPVPKNTIRLLPQGCEPVRELATREDARRRLGMSGNIPIFLSVGALTKSEADLLNATLKRLFERRPECLFVMIGRHRARIRPEILADPRFVQTGFISSEKLLDYMAACHALLTPLSNTLASRARWPSKVNDFLSVGRTTVMSRVGDLANLLEREEAGLVGECDPDELVDRLLQLSDEPELRDHCENRARHVAATILPWTKLVEELETFYRQVRMRDGAV